MGGSGPSVGAKGSVVDRGGAWLGPKHDAIFGLAREVGVSTYKTYVEGAHLLIGEGQTRRYSGLIPKISPLAVGTIAWAQLRLDRLAKKLPLEEPWTASKAAEWDERSIAWYLEHTGIRTTLARDLFDMAIRGLFAGDLNEVSFLNLLMLVRGHGSINTLFSIENGAQENLVDGGAGSIAMRVAADLGDAVRLSAPVRAVDQQSDHLVVEAADLSVSARHVIVTVPPALALEIAFDPALPDDRATLVPQRDRRPGGEDDRGLRRTVLEGRRLERSGVRAGRGVRGHDRRLADVGHSGSHRLVHLRTGRRTDAGARRGGTS